MGREKCKRYLGERVADQFDMEGIRVGGIRLTGVQFSDAVKPNWTIWEEREARQRLGQQGAYELVLDLTLRHPKENQWETASL